MDMILVDTLIFFIICVFFLLLGAYGLERIWYYWLGLILERKKRIQEYEMEEDEKRDEAFDKAVIRFAQLMQSEIIQEMITKFVKSFQAGMSNDSSM